MRRIERDNRGSMKPGQDLVIAGYAGWAGTLRAVQGRREELLTKFTGEYLEHILETEDTELAVDLEFWKAAGASEAEPAGEGGISTALWNISGAYLTGITFELRNIPVRQATIEICEYFDMNPYRLDSSNCLILAADNGGNLVEKLKQLEICAAVIGKVTTGIKRIITHGESRGYLDRPARDEIYKVIPCNSLKRQENRFKSGCPEHLL